MATMEETVQKMLGQQMFQIAALSSQLEAAQEKIAELEKLVPKPKEVTRENKETPKA